MGVFDMGFVPSDRGRKAMMDRQLGKDLPIVVFRSGPVPVPAGGVLVVRAELEDPRHEIDGEPELMRALPRSRFRGAFGEQVVLPVGAAETLERFESELRAVGLIRKGEVLRQGAKLPSHFRVQVGKGKGSSLDVHELSSLKTPDLAAGAFRERAPTLRCSERNASPEPASGEGQPIRGAYTVKRRSRPAL